MSRIPTQSVLTDNQVDRINEEVMKILSEIGVDFEYQPAVDVLKEHGCKSIRFMCIIAAPEGVKRMQEVHPDVDIFIAALDDHLNEHGYIVPGLGDAGDRIFGTK